MTKLYTRSVLTKVEKIQSFLFSQAEDGVCHPPPKKMAEDGIFVEGGSRGRASQGKKHISMVSFLSSYDLFV